MDIHTGIPKDKRKEIAAALNHLLADSYLLYLKSHNYHWNVTGELFHSLHELFEEHYSELAEAIDEIAERIRALGFRAPGSFEEYSKLATVEEETDNPDAMEMIRRAVRDHEKVVRTAREALGPCQEVDDEATIDLLTERLAVHEKSAWMLRSHLE